MEPLGGSDAAPEYPTLARVAATARHWWWALVIGALAGAALALAAVGSSNPRYEASARLLVGPIGGEYSVLRASGQQAQTYADLATSRPVLDATIRHSRLAQTADELRRRVDARADDVTRLLTINVQADGASAAANTANALAAELQRVTQVDHPTAGGELRIIDPAQPPGGPMTRRAGALVLLAGLAGLLGVLALVLVLDLTRRLIATEEELAAAIPVPVLGTVRRRSRLAQTHVEVAGLLAADRRSVVVAGVQDEGSGARGALALAGALTAAGAHVVIIDAGAGRGSASLSWLVRLDDRPGLLEALAAPISGTRAADLEALTVADGPQLQVLPRGRRERAGRVDPRRAERLVRRLGRAADMVVVSGSPTSALSGAATWGGVSDGVVLAVRRHRTSRDAVREAAEALARADVDVLGTLLVVQTAFGARPRRRRRAARAPATAPATLTPATDRLRELQT